MQILFNYAEVLGLVGMAFVGVSYVITGRKRKRWTNTIAAAFFTLYGFILQSISVCLTASMIMVVQLWELYKLNKVKAQQEKSTRIFTYDNKEIETLRR